jgi:hypothetical protein
MILNINKDMFNAFMKTKCEIDLAIHEFVLSFLNNCINENLPLFYQIYQYRNGAITYDDMTFFSEITNNGDASGINFSESYNDTYIYVTVYSNTYSTDKKETIIVIPVNDFLENSMRLVNEMKTLLNIATWQENNKN